ncbi:toxic anion resistance protein [Virgibacillus siamensis]|uniref:Toxic anion resistance protein n=1 Tax=Virgibacillus siamensis TaxID=480071 RepID=A0ABN1FNA3_9BACI
MSENTERNRDAMDDLLANPFGEQNQNQQQTPTESGEDQDNKLVDTLSEEDRKRAMDLSEQIDPDNYQSITEYGTDAQSKLMNFSHSMLDNVKNKDVGDISSILTDLMKRLEQVNPDELQPEKRGLFSRVFGKVSGSVNEIMSKYQKTGAQIDKISIKLERSKDVLTKDNNLLQEMFYKNRDYFDALNVYIAAGEVKRDKLINTTIPELKQKAEQTQNQMDTQEVNDVMQFAERLDKRLHDLRLSKQITLQTAPQIRLIQNTNQALVEKIQSSILTSIPLWKNQIAIALTLLRQQNAVEAQKEVSKTTNELLLKNSDMLKTNTIETAKENERGVVDIETLKKTQENLLSTIEETMRIQTEGREKRKQAEEEITGMENEMKQKLLELGTNRS